MNDDQLAEQKRVQLIDRIQFLINSHRSGSDSQGIINSMVTTLFRAHQHQAWVDHQINPCDDRGSGGA
jgi:uncharacterized protein YeeX (DUF496 family)